MTPWTARRLARRPLHFVALGGLLFAALHPTSSPSEPHRPLVQATSPEHADDEILFREALAAGFDETDKVVRERLVGLGRDLRLAAPDDDDALEREARALGLHRSDPLIRRHLIDMTRLAAAGSAGGRQPPDETALRAAYEAEPLRYALPPRVSFTHVFLSRDRRGADLASDATTLLATLRSTPADPPAAAAAGDSFVRGARLRRASGADIGRVFGRAFAAAVLALPPGQWGGPLESPYGLHLVHVREQLPAESPPFEAVRATLLHTRLREERAQRVGATLDRLRQRYDVRIGPHTGAEGCTNPDRRDAS